MASSSASSQKAALKFATVWEDPAVEVYALPDGKSKSERDDNHMFPSSVCLIASAGDTAVALLKHGGVGHMDLVDLNVAQLDLARLKLLCALSPESPEAEGILYGVLGAYQADCDSADAKKRSKSVPRLEWSRVSGRTSQATVDLWFSLNLARPAEALTPGDLSHPMSTGVLDKGLYEIMLRQWRESGWKTKKLFKKSRLQKTFGKAAVSSTKSFASHFRGVKEALEKEDKSNVFRQRLFDGVYEPPLYGFLVRAAKSPSGKLVPPRSGSKSPSEQLRPLIALHENSLTGFLSAPPCERTYDLIQSSNITDWMSKDQRLELYQAAKARLKVGGKLLCRRLCGNYSLTEELARLFGEDNLELVTKLDTSRFYSEVVLATLVALAPE